MTRRRDLKRRVRDPQAQTGESYMTALRHVQAQVHDLDAEPRPARLLITSHTGWRLPWAL